MRNTVASPTQ